MTSGLFTTAKAGVNFSTLVSFAGTNGATPMGCLVQGNDGNFYGVTQAGGGYGDGTIFQLKPDFTLTTLASFDGTNGNLPHAGLVLGMDGNFYGTTGFGGAYNQGTVFRVAPAGILTSLFSFDGTNGGTPSGELIVGTNGNLYGTCETGGPFTNSSGSTCGTIFEITAEGLLTTLHQFDNTNGSSPWAALAQGRDGTLYGTTRDGGPVTNSAGQGAGSLFRITPDGAFSVVRFFDLTNNGASFSGLVKGPDGSLYGTGEGGVYQDMYGGALGNIFRATPEGLFTNIFSFAGTNGCFPRALMMASDGNLYGVTGFGGIGYDGYYLDGHGVIFRVTAAGEFTLLYMFTDGELPFGGLVQGTDGNLYGTTRGGGAYGNGTVFRLTVPMAPVFQQVVHDGNTFRFTWSAVAGLSYQVQYRANLEQSAWVNLGVPMTATNDTMTASDTIGPDIQRVYRISLLP